MRLTLSRPQGVLFDLDGTLLDTADDMGAALNRMLKEAQRPTISSDAYRPIASHGARGMLGLGYDIAPEHIDYPELRRQFLDYYSQAICRHTQLYPSVEGLITTLTQAGVPWGIVTNKPQQLTEQLLKYFGVLQSAQVVLCGDSLSRRKPDPMPLTVAAEHLKADATLCWYIGDARRDMEAANSAGMIAILAEYGYIHPDEGPDDWPAQHRIADLSTLAALFD